MILIINEFACFDFSKSLLKNNNKLYKFCSCNNKKIMENVINHSPNAIVISDKLLLSHDCTEELLYYIKQSNIALLITLDYSTFNGKSITIDQSVMIIGCDLLSHLLTETSALFLEEHLKNKSILTYSYKEKEIIKSLFSGKSIQSLCSEFSFMKKTISTHISNIKNKSGLRSRQQLYYLYSIQKKLKLI